MQTSTPRQLKHTAAEWYLRSLSESFGEAERARLQDWLADDPDHIRAFNEARVTWQAMEGLRDDPELMAEAAGSARGIGFSRPFQSHGATVGSARRVGFSRPSQAHGGLKSALQSALQGAFSRKAGMGALATAATLVVGLALGWQLGLFDDGVYTTEPWEHRTIMLSDGSTVTLSANTVVEDTTDEDRRGAVVRRGEAIFDVVTDKANPFIVRAADAEIVVTGTRFQVRRDAGKVAVTLIEGRVRVERAPPIDAVRSSPHPTRAPARGEGVSSRTTNNDHFDRTRKDGKAGTAAARRGPHTDVRPQQRATILQPGQQLAFAETGETAELREVDVDAVTAWSRNRLVFRDAPLAEALREANRHSDVKLVLQDPTLADVRVNGHFRLGDNESLLAAVRGSFPIQAYRVDKDEIVLTRAR